MGGVAVVAPKTIFRAKRRGRDKNSIFFPRRRPSTRVKVPLLLPSLDLRNWPRAAATRDARSSVRHAWRRRVCVHMRGNIAVGYEEEEEARAFVVTDKGLVSPPPPAAGIIVPLTTSVAAAGHRV